MLDRYFAGKRTLSRKWRAYRHPDLENVIVVCHYHHLVLMYDLFSDRPLYTWWERPADKRGLDACLEYLKKRSMK